MRKVIISVFIIIFSITIGLSNNAGAELSPNTSFLMEGSGFLVSEKVVDSSQLDILISTKSKIGANIGLIASEGIISIEGDDFDVAGISGNILRDGRFVRIAGIGENPSGDKIEAKLFGRLIEDSSAGSVYSFTGRITQDSESIKVIYTSKISKFTKIIQTLTPEKPTTSQQTKEVVIHINKGSSTKAASSYTEAIEGPRRSYYSMDRITIEPGTKITFVNDDTVSHSITSGTGLGQFDRLSKSGQKICDGTELREGGRFSSADKFVDCAFTIDGRISSGEILPGESWSVIITERGFYRLIDVDYNHMTITVYAFPQMDSIILGSSKNLGN